MGGLVPEPPPPPRRSDLEGKRFLWVWDEVWKGGLSGKTVWMKGLLAKTCRIMMMILITMVFVM